jgi:hypothetical protein
MLLCHGILVIERTVVGSHQLSVCVCRLGVSGCHNIGPKNESVEVSLDQSSVRESPVQTLQRELPEWKELSMHASMYTFAFLIMEDLDAGALAYSLLQISRECELNGVGCFMHSLTLEGQLDSKRVDVIF